MKKANGNVLFLTGFGVAVWLFMRIAWHSGEPSER